MSITISWQPSVLVPTPTRYKILRKANTDTPLDSWKESAFVELDELTGESAITTYTDATGADGYWYRVKTGDANFYAPAGPPIPWHGNVSFARLRAGVGWLASFGPNSINASELYAAETEATLWVVSELLRPQYSDADIFAGTSSVPGFYEDPPPTVRKITELVAALELMRMRKPELEEAIQAIQLHLDKLIKRFVSKKERLMTDMSEKLDSNEDPAADVRITWDR